MMDRHPKMAVSEERQGQPWQVGAGLEICGPDRVCHRQVTVLSGLSFPICSVTGGLQTAEPLRPCAAYCEAGLGLHWQVSTPTLAGS